jgi:hypothetical protein
LGEKERTSALHKSALALLAENDGRLLCEPGSGLIEVKAENGLVKLSPAEFNELLEAQFIARDDAPVENGRISYRITAAGRRFALTWV